MKFLIDNALSPDVAEGLREAGYDVAHIRDYGMQSAEDEEILELALKEDRIIVSADTDFGTLLALYQKTKPSFILFRQSFHRRPSEQILLLTDNLPSLTEYLENGAIIVIEDTRVRIRILPISN
ncbi:MAG: DUF5615 family PIN-like protein [Bacteroidetes bacterium]|nr:DUF5615 family PIN-like protein [Bacteroidota bacterium]MBU1422751.1 DUF5615 family PIN-like protein [Bacteroidota bacterium]MBU2471630.1 DUF5615 family PIN-like protein [Bacteroidota bacterium]MBU2635535.1 DUF5615 family PIN-like protein [Bacteroidota bacterium]